MLDLLNPQKFLKNHTFKNYERGIGYTSGGFGKSQALESFDDPITAIEKGGFTVSMAALGFLIKKGGKEVAEEAAEDILKYAPTAKHTNKFAKNADHSFMDLGDGAAQDLLSNSLSGGTKQRYGYQNGKLYEFQPDNVGSFHGYPIPGNQAPNSVLKQLLQNGQINQAQYNKMIKGK